MKKCLVKNVFWTNVVWLRKWQAAHHESSLSLVYYTQSGTAKAKGFCSRPAPFPWSNWSQLSSQLCRSRDHPHSWCCLERISAYPSEQGKWIILIHLNLPHLKKGGFYFDIHTVRVLLPVRFILQLTSAEHYYTLPDHKIQYPSHWHFSFLTCIKNNNNSA